MDEILGKLLVRMLQEEPNDRPTAAEAYQELERIRQSLGSQLKHRITRGNDDGPLEALSFHYGNVARALWFNPKKKATLYEKTLHIPYVLPAAVQSGGPSAQGSQCTQRRSGHQ